MTKKIVAVLALLSTRLVAGPYIDADDVFVRMDLQTLADAGVIRAPVSTFPLPWASIVSDVQSAQANDDLTAEALARIRLQLRNAREQAVVDTRISVASGIESMRHYGDEARSDHEARLRLRYTGSDWFSARLSLQQVDELPDLGEKRTTVDGSYMAALLGNWSMGAGTLDRWWGPANDSGLILSNNARPVPAVFLQRQSAEAFETPWMSWIGPWTMNVFLGQLESERDVPNARFFGMRLNWRPFTALELGLSRTAQFGGEGRDGGLNVFWDMLIGNDNFYADDQGKATEPGNQMAGLDLRWRLWRGEALTTTAYLEYIGEDEANGAPSHKITTVGLQLSHRDWAAWQSFIEYSDTFERCFGGNASCIYNHGIYRDGYRYFGRTIGSSYDNDTQSTAFGLLYQPDANWRSSLILRDIKANIDALNGERLNDRHQWVAAGAAWQEAELRWQYMGARWRFTLQARGLSEKPFASELDDRVLVSFERVF